MRFFICLWITVVLGADTAAQSSVPSFTIAMPYSSEIPPYIWLDRTTGKPVGSIIDNHELVAQKLGYHLRWRLYHPTQDQQVLFEEFQRGEIDILINKPPPTFDEANLVLLKPSMPMASLNVFTPSNSQLAQLTVDALPDFRGVSTTMTTASLDRLLEKHPVLSKDLQLVSAEDMPSSIIAIQQGQADYSFAERSSLIIALRNAGVIDNYQIMEPPLGYFLSFMYYNPQSDFTQYEKGLLDIFFKYLNNGRLEHIKIRNMRRYIRENHDRTD
ncbi:transporter substrate-binding domain-containing protein [Oceanicoccus sp. KOV_DT_Chl]|uniref:transporter substrate-binding domain-containing protein n=1 Tax=Oceanicoccus sp. KOV_DT_Chl TaxID=1904639 RepID=UPI000C7B03BD|nr:transporter substrate-binding domain-containing protein [Oceanicoccus sp. KOV_DT_Chl]